MHLRAFHASCAKAAPECTRELLSSAAAFVQILENRCQISRNPCSSPLARPLLNGRRSSPASSRGRPTDSFARPNQRWSQATLPGGSPMRQGITRVGRYEKPPATSPFSKMETECFRRTTRLTWHAHIQRPGRPGRPRSKWRGDGGRAPGRFQFISSPPLSPRPNLPGRRRRN